MRTGFLRVAAGALTGWLLPPLLIAVIVGVLGGAAGEPAGDGLVDAMIKALFYGVVIGLPASLGVLIMLVSPTWFFLHRRRAGRRGFLIAGGVIGGLMGLVSLAGPALGGDTGGWLHVVLTLAVPAVVGALTFLFIRRIAYGRSD